MLLIALAELQPISYINQAPNQMNNECNTPELIVLVIIIQTIVYINYELREDHSRINTNKNSYVEIHMN